MKLFLLALSLFTLPMLRAGDLKIVDPWIRAVPPSSTATAAFMTIINKTDAPVVITKGTSPVSEDIRPMITTKQEHEVMGMAFVDSFEIPANGKRVLEPGGDHIMLMELKEVPKAGSTVSLILETKSKGQTGRISLDIPVR